MYFNPLVIQKIAEYLTLYFLIFGRKIFLNLTLSFHVILRRKYAFLTPYYTKNGEIFNPLFSNILAGKIFKI